MAKLRAIVINGRVIVQGRVNFPEGTELEITPVVPTVALDEQERAALRLMFADQSELGGYEKD